MNHPVDVHPEDLLDREQYGLLSSEEQRRLDTHCVQCSACDIVRSVTRDFASERHVNSADPVMLDRLVEAAMGSPMPASAHNAPVSFMPRRRGKPWAVAAVIMFAATGAAASFGSVRRAVVERAIAPVMRAFADQRPATVAGAAIPKKALAAAPKVFEPVPERIVLPLASRAPVAREPAAAVVRPPKPVEEAAVPSAEQLLKSINEARRRNDTAQALQLYRRLQREYPGSPEEATSTYTLGRALYESGEDTAGALAMFNRYLAESSNGTLAEEARLGRAQALQRLGRSSEERQAWLDLLSAHPRSVHAERARRRLEQLR
jgi:TolA-binding protein